MIKGFRGEESRRWPWREPLGVVAGVLAVAWIIAAALGMFGTPVLDEHVYHPIISILSEVVEMVGIIINILLTLGKGIFVAV